MSRTYPAEAVGGFPRPPREVTDREGRTLRIRRLRDRENLVEMYRAFDPEDKAQGIPPSGESSIREWLDRITHEGSVNVVTRHDTGTVGHATFVGGEEYELAIFVLQAYQGAGVGTDLLRTALGAAAASGVEHVWLSVEHWNRAAIDLYTKVGFESVESPHFDKEMTIRLESGGD